MSQGNDFATVRAYLDFWGEHPRRTEALAALERIEAALRFYRDEWTVPAIGPRDEPSPNMRLLRDQGRTAAARFAETAEGEGT